jgi:hypothetical protein
VPGCGDVRRGSTVRFFLAGGSPSCALWRGVASSLLAGFWPLAFASSSDSLCVSLNLQQVDIYNFLRLIFAILAYFFTFPGVYALYKKIFYFLLCFLFRFAREILNVLFVLACFRCT